MEGTGNIKRRRYNISEINDLILINRIPCIDGGLLNNPECKNDAPSQLLNH